MVSDISPNVYSNVGSVCMCLRIIRFLILFAVLKVHGGLFNIINLQNEMLPWISSAVACENARYIALVQVSTRSSNH